MPAQSPAIREARCQLCAIVLGFDPEDDLERRLCVTHKNDPRTRKLHAVTGGRPGAARLREFTPADKSLIRSTHGYMPIADLLRVLNERLHADQGADVPAYTLEQLHRELQACATESAAGWASLRQVLTQARRSGVLAQISGPVIDDFATVWQLSPAQVMNLRDVIRGAQEGS
jgi:hypothetical protein